MLKIRLSRTGKNRQPSFRVIVQEHTSAVKGKFIEVLGYYRPAANPKEFKVDLDKIKYWISVGAQPSDSLAVLLKKEGLEGLDKYIAPRNKKRKKTKEDQVAPAAPVAAEAPKAEAPKVEEAAPVEAPVEAPPAEEPKAKEPAAVEEPPKTEEAPTTEPPTEETPTTEETAPAEEPIPEESKS